VTCTIVSLTLKEKERGQMTSQNAQIATVYGGRLFQTLITVLTVLILLLALPLSIAAETSEIHPTDVVAQQDTGTSPDQTAAKHHSCSFQNSCSTLVFLKTSSLTAPVHNSSQFKNFPQTIANDGRTVSVILPPPLRS
jgi:hypothetical protein